jgi:hypothetical protein
MQLYQVNSAAAHATIGHRRGSHAPGEERGQQRKDTTVGWEMPMVRCARQNRMGDLPGLWPILSGKGLG